MFHGGVHCHPYDQHKDSNGLGPKDTRLLFNLLHGDHNPAPEQGKKQTKRRTTDVNGERIGMVKCDGLLELPLVFRSGVILITNQPMNPKRTARHIIYQHGQLAAPWHKVQQLSEWDYC